ncbi:Rac1 GTP binding protein [Pelomyxa schiedti]|nr:Rac1 GTP binding protein [Pelomyxa schiedti]
MQKLKIVAVGDVGVGKTSMFVRYASGSFPSKYVPSEFENYTVNVMFDDKPYHLGLWDTAGGDREILRPLSYPETNLFIVCFSVFSPLSLENVRCKWHPEISHYCPGIPFILVGTKHDLRIDPVAIKHMIDCGVQDLAPVSFEVASEMAMDLHASAYIEISSLTGDHVQDLFTHAIRIATTGSTGMPHSTRKKSVSSFSWGNLWNTLWNAVPIIGTWKPPLLSVFEMLPHELWVKIFSFCGPKDLFRLSAVCRDFRALASSDGLWTRFIPTSIISSSSNKGVPLKSLFKSSGACYIYTTTLPADWIFVP